MNGLCEDCDAESGAIGTAPGLAHQSAAGRRVAVTAVLGRGVGAAEVDHVAAAAADVFGVPPFKPPSIKSLFSLG